MKPSENGWVRGAIVVGIAGAMMAVALLSPALAGKYATKKFVKSQVSGLQTQINQAQSAANAAQTTANTANAAAAAHQTQTFVRSAPIPVGAGTAAAGEIACPAGMVATGGGATVSNSALLMNDSVPTDGTGTFAPGFGLTAGAGFTAWGAIVTSTGGAGTFRVYASCRTATQGGSNYTSGVAALRSSSGGGFTSG
jgi:hypothetical protein